jgi:high affinity Mn2+ porin
MYRKFVSFSKAILLSIFLITLTGLMQSQDNTSAPAGPPFPESGGTAERGLTDKPRRADNGAREIAGSLVLTSSVPTNTYALPAIAEAAKGQLQRWNWHAQSTLIVQGYPGLAARYSGPNSLPTSGAARETLSMDVYGGFRLWNGAEAHFDLLTWQGFGLNDTLGIEAFPNGEAYKAGTSFPRSNVARLFIRQNIGLQSQREAFVQGDELTLAGKQDISRLTVTIGRFSLKDIFDNNTYANDPRKQFMNWALMANAAWDYPSDALGYTTGAAVELNQPNWALRYGFFQIDRMRNAWTSEDQLFTWPGYSGAGDGAFWRSWGMASEFERRYSIDAHPGAIRFLT